MDTNPLVGTWRLISQERREADGRVTHPFGRNICGILTYTADGYMCVAIMNADRPRAASDNFLETTDAERAASAQGYVSYAGRYELTDGKIFHHVEISLFPNWIGGTQERSYTFAGDRLTLSTGPGTLVWERVAQT